MSILNQKFDPELLELGRQKNAMLDRWIREHTEGSNTVVELGAGQFGRLGKVRPQARKIGIEIFPPYASLAPVDVKCILGDMRDWKRFLSNGDCDTAMLIDSIEHIPKEDGVLLLRGLQEEFRKIILFTPEGFYPQFEDELGHENEYQVHECGWTKPELELLGFKVDIDPCFHVLKGNLGAIFAVWGKTLDS